MRWSRSIPLFAVGAFLVSASVAGADGSEVRYKDGRMFSNPPLPAEMARTLPATPAARDDLNRSQLDSGGTPNQIEYFVHAEDVSTIGKQCIGLDCTGAEAFGFDTIRLKENNVRIKFEDTSNSGSFPNKDWQLTANESINGGLNLFSIDNVTDGQSPLVLRDNAGNNAIYAVDSKVGFGTNAPARALHAVEGDTPSLRLDQQGGGFPAYVWDVGGNEANFFIANYEGGPQKLPFRIFPGAPNNGICIASNGRVGLGTTGPSAQLQVHGATPTIRATNSSSGLTTLDLDANGNLTLAGLLLESSSREVKENLVPVDRDEVLDRVADLNLYRWNYRTDDPSSTHLGPVAEDFSAAFGLGPDDKHISAIDLSGVTLSAVQALERRNREKDATIAEMKSEIEQLRSALKALADRVDAK